MSAENPEFEKDLRIKGFIEPVEQVIEPDRTTTVFEVGADTDQDLDEITDHLVEEHGFHVGNPTTPTGSSFGFSSSRWNSPWNPSGPKKNWGPPPEDKIRNN
jgi:hypothetical protein